MSILPTAISTLASFESSVMMLGSPAEAYNYGFQYIWWIFGMCLSLYIAVTIVVPVIHPMQITSAYEVWGQCVAKKHNKRPWGMRLYWKKT